LRNLSFGRFAVRGTAPAQGSHAPKSETRGQVLLELLELPLIPTIDAQSGQGLAQLKPLVPG
jgi:hypothetical protein